MFKCILRKLFIIIIIILLNSFNILTLIIKKN